MSENIKRPCEFCSAKLVSEGVHGGTSWECGTFESAWPVKVRRSEVCLRTQLSAAEQRVRELEGERDAAKEIADDMTDAFLSTGGMWCPCSVCKLGSLVRLGESRGDGGVAGHVCGACVAIELRAELTSLTTERDELRRDADLLTKYFKLTEDARGKQHYAADGLLEHFNEDGSLKGTGSWRVLEIHKWIKRFVESENELSEQLEFEKMVPAIDAALKARSDHE